MSLADARGARRHLHIVEYSSAGALVECVMLNKGPHILDAMRVLEDILKRMQSHQTKKRSLLRALGAWAPAQQA